MGDMRTIDASDQAGIATAIVLHAALGATLIYVASLPIPVKEEEITPPQGLTVSLATDVGLASEGSEIVLESRASVAPELGEPSASSPDPAPLPDVSDASPTTPTPAPTTPASTTTRRNSTPTRPSSRSSSRSSTSRSSSSSSSSTTRRNAGGSRVGDDFLPGSGTSRTSTGTRLPASQIGASAKASIQSQMIRELRPHWRGKSPSGSDAEKLKTIVAFRLNPDGSLNGSPRVVRQSGVNALNQSQKARHAEIALRAVRLAAPFDLPEEYYNAWKNIRALEFNKEL